MAEKKAVIPVERIESRIFLIRGEKVLLDADLAGLYGVGTRALVQAVKRNTKRFPEDFMFQLSQEEFDALRSQSVISKPQGRGGRRYLPFAFTEQGVAMLSSVLHSERAVLVNIEIMRAFVRLRQLLATHKELAEQFKELKRRVTTHDEQIRAIFDAIRRLVAPSEPKCRKIGFLVKEKRARYGG